MASIFAFYRARNVTGCYVVGIQLDLLPTESAEVRHQGHLQEPVKKMQSEGQRELYRIDQVIQGNTISIQIHDTQLLPYQLTRYTAEVDGFTIEDIPYRHKLNYGSDIFHNYGVIILNSITMIDCDKEDVVIQATPSKKKRQSRAKKHQAQNGNSP